MTDNRELEVAFAKRGIKKNVVAKELGISLNSLRRKATNQTQFKADEICKLIKIMNLLPEFIIHLLSVLILVTQQLKMVQYMLLMTILLIPEMT